MISSSIAAIRELPEGGAPSPGAILELWLCSRWNAGALSVVRAWASAASCDWDAVLEQALAADLAPLLYTILRGLDIAPAAVERALRAAYEANAIRSVLMLDALELVLARLNKAGIPVILLKGAVLAETVYGNAAMRPMTDLDLLVRRDHVTRALELLADVGYRPVRPEMRPGAVLAYENERMLSKPGMDGAPLELHWHLFDSPSHQHDLSMDWFWETAAPLRLGNETVLGLGSEACLLYLCAHLALHHRGEGLKWWLDIAGVITMRGNELAWGEVLRRAQAADLVVPLQEVLIPLAETWKVPIPAAVLAELSAMRLSAVELRMRSTFAGLRLPAGQRFLADLTNLPTWRMRASFAWAHLIPSAEYMRDRYRPRRAWFLPLLYPYRWCLGFAGILSGRVPYRSQPTA